MSNDQPTPYIGNGRLLHGGRCVRMVINVSRLQQLAQYYAYSGQNGRYMEVDMFMKKQVDSKGNHYHVKVRTDRPNCPGGPGIVEDENENA
jgi:hypothetical protein